MKKLLLLLLFIPTLIQAEEFILICEGEKATFDNYANVKKYIDKIGVKVREESIEIGKNTYSTRGNNFIESSYTKTNDLISVFQISKSGSNNESCSQITYMAEINRITGIIRTSWRLTDPCMDEGYFSHATYDGECKKQKNNPF